MMALTLVLIVALVCLLIINYFIANEFYEVAVLKGYSSKKYFWISFFMGVIGYLLVISLPVTNAIQSNDIISDELPEL